LIGIDVEQDARLVRRMKRREDLLANAEVSDVEVRRLDSLGHRECELSDLGGRDHGARISRVAATRAAS